MAAAKDDHRPALLRPVGTAELLVQACTVAVMGPDRERHHHAVPEQAHEGRLEALRPGPERMGRRGSQMPVKSDLSIK